jgi:hypothetical protein
MKSEAKVEFFIKQNDKGRIGDPIYTRAVKRRREE